MISVIRKLTIFGGAALAVLICGIESTATPSSHIWTPSVDVQAYKTCHVTTDVYIPVKKPRGIRPGTITNLGLTWGLKPMDKVSAEFGFDHIEGTYPIYLNAKLGIAENAYGNSPAMAAGLFQFGLNRDGEARTGYTAKTGTDYDLYYVKAGKTVPNIGRLSFGYYTGNKRLLVDQDGRANHNGYLMTWEKTIPSISENFSANIDYQGGKSTYGALTYGFAWRFASNTFVTFGFVDQLNDRINPGNTFVVEVDIDFDFPPKR